MLMRNMRSFLNVSNNKPYLKKKKGKSKNGWAETKNCLHEQLAEQTRLEAIQLAEQETARELIS